MSTVLSIKSTKKLIEKSLLVVAALNVLMENRNIKFNFKTKRLSWNSTQTANEKVMEMLRQFLFLFGQFFALNYFSEKGFKKSSFPLAFLISYLSSKCLKVNVPLLLSSFILTRIGFAFFDNLDKRKLIKRPNLIFLLVFVSLMTINNFIFLLDRNLYSKRILKNYVNIGLLDDLVLLEYDLIGEKMKSK